MRSGVITILTNLLNESSNVSFICTVWSYSVAIALSTSSRAARRAGRAAAMMPQRMATTSTAAIVVNGTLR